MKYTVQIILILIVALIACFMLSPVIMLRTLDRLVRYMSKKLHEATNKVNNLKLVRSMIDKFFALEEYIREL